MPMSLEFNIFIDSWAGKHGNAAQIASTLHASGYPVILIHTDDNDSELVAAARRYVVPNEWRFGSKFKKSLDEFDGDVLLNVVADACCDDWSTLVQRCRNAYTQFPQLGIWSPRIEGSDAWAIRRTGIMAAEVASLQFVTQTNSIVWALSKEVVGRLRLFDYDRNNCGWGIDIAASLFCHVNNRLVAIDRDVCVYHPYGIGYDIDEARTQMNDFLKQLTLQEQIQHILMSEYVAHKTT
jgi:hypothetical protein